MLQTFVLLLNTSFGFPHHRKCCSHFVSLPPSPLSLSLFLSLCPCRVKREEEYLSILDVQNSDEGTYTCSVKTDLDQDSSSARLIVLGRHTQAHTHKHIHTGTHLTEWMTTLLLSPGVVTVTS